MTCPVCGGNCELFDIRVNYNVFTYYWRCWICEREFMTIKE